MGMKPWQSIRISVMALVLIVSMAGRSHAQFFPYFENMGPFLSNADFTFADAATRELMEPEPAPLGTVAAWNNPASGNNGVLTMGRAYEKDGNTCRIVSWYVAFKDGPHHTVMLDTCRITGVWKLM